jgi:hypothetical protein
MKRIRAHVEITRRTSIEFAELAQWEDDPPEVVSFEVLEEPRPPKESRS